MEERLEEPGGPAEGVEGAGGGPGAPWATDIEGLLAKQGPKLSAILARNRIPPVDADDLLSNVLLQLWRKRNTILNPAAWLPGAVKNECRMYWRTRSRSFTRAVDGAILELVGEGAPPSQERHVLRDTLRRWIGALDQRCRSILHLRYHLGYEPREVAEELGYRPSSIDKVTRRCLDALGRKVAAAEPAPALRDRKRPATDGTADGTVDGAGESAPGDGPGDADPAAAADTPAADTPQDDDAPSPADRTDEPGAPT